MDRDRTDTAAVVAAGVCVPLIVHLLTLLSPQLFGFAVIVLLFLHSSAAYFHAASMSPERMGSGI